MVILHRFLIKFLRAFNLLTNFPKTLASKIVFVYRIWVGNHITLRIVFKYNFKISSIYKTFKVVKYFQLKSKIPFAVCSNVVYEYLCSCDTNKTYIGMSSRHLITRVREHLNFKSLQISAIKDHIL